MISFHVEVIEFNQNLIPICSMLSWFIKNQRVTSLKKSESLGNNNLIHIVEEITILNTNNAGTSTNNVFGKYNYFY